jgi:hypothetical protein
VDPTFAPYLARRGVVLPIAVSFVFLVRLWREGELFGTSGTLFCVWFVLAAVLQVFAPNLGLWILGVAAQTTLAIVLILKQQLSEM